MKKNIFTRIIAIALVAMSIMAIATTAMAYTEHSTSGIRYVTSVNGYVVNVRQGPGTNYDKAPIGSLYVGAEVSLVSYSNDSGSYWYQVRFEGTIVGWIKGEFLTTNSTVHDSLSAWQIRYGWRTTSGDAGNSTPAQIKNIQRDLNYLGYGNNLSVDGYYGTQTKAAVKRLQADLAQSQTGLATESLKIALYNARFN